MTCELAIGVCDREPSSLRTSLPEVIGLVAGLAATGVAAGAILIGDARTAAVV